MNKVKAKHIILTKSDDMNELQFIEQIGRTCYKSEDKITEDGESAKKFVSMLIHRGHEAMIEHWSYIFMCSEETYHQFSHLLMTLEDLGYRLFIRKTNMLGRHIISGNIRAWRDLLRACSRHNLIVPKWLIYHLVMKCPIKQVLFSDLIREDVSISRYDEDVLDAVCELQKDDLLEKERYVHYDLTIKFICDRGISHEIVRHRQSSFAQESTRYCNYANDKFGNSISVIDILPGMILDKKMHSLSCDTIAAIMSEWEEAMIDAERHYMKMLELGASPQIARDVLSTSTKTELVMTANLDEWFKFFSLRLPDSAHPQMRELTYKAYEDVLELEPFIFENITAVSGN